MRADVALVLAQEHVAAQAGEIDVVLLQPEMVEEEAPAFATEVGDLQVNIGHLPGLEPVGEDVSEDVDRLLLTTIRASLHLTDADADVVCTITRGLEPGVDELAASLLVGDVIVINVMVTILQGLHREGLQRRRQSSTAGVVFILALPVRRHCEGKSKCSVVDPARLLTHGRRNHSWDVKRRTKTLTTLT